MHTDTTSAPGADAARSGSSSQFTDDLPCVNCGYNLRGLATDTNCPECGCPAPMSLREDRLMDAPGPYRQRLRRGALTLAVAVAVSPVLNVVAVLGAVAALWMLTARQPDRDEPASDWRCRVAARLGIGAWTLITMPLLAAVAIGRRPLYGDWWIYDGLLIAAQAAMALGLLAAWAHVVILLERVPAPAQARRFRQLRVHWLAGLLGITAVGAGVNAVRWLDMSMPLLRGPWGGVVAMGLVALILLWLWMVTLRATLALQAAMAPLGHETAAELH